MKWGLLFDDIAARLFGLVGLYVCFIYAEQVLEPTGTEISVLLKSGLMMFATAGALTYLIPSFHDSAIKISHNFFGRLIFLLASLAWGALMVLGLELSLHFGLGYLSIDAGRNLAMAMLFGFGAYVFLFIFPVGISYRYAHEFDSPVGAPNRSNQFYHPGSDSVPEPKIRVERGPRTSDLLDKLILLPLWGVVGLTAYAFFADSVAPTQSLDALAHDFVLAGLVAAAFLILFKPLVTAVRRPVAEKRRLPLLQRLLFLLIALPTLSAILFFSATYHAVPWVWQKWKPGAEASLQYVVTKSSFDNLLGGCLGLSYQETEDRSFTVCALDSATTDELLPGDVITATGMLSQYGHSLTELQVVSRVPRAPLAPTEPVQPDPSDTDSAEEGPAVDGDETAEVAVPEEGEVTSDQASGN